MKNMDKEIQKEIEQHGERLVNIINNHVTGDKDDTSFLSKKEVEKMLDNHFIRVENLLKSYGNPQSKTISFSDQYKEFQHGLKKLSEDFIKTIKNGFASAKEKLNSKVDKIQEEVRDKVNDVKKQAEIKIKQTVLNWNDSIKDKTKEFTNAVDEKFAIEDEKVAPNKVNAETIKEPYEQALLIQENYGLTSNTVQWENEKFLQHLKEVDPDEYKKFLLLKELHLAENIQDKTEEKKPLNSENEKIVVVNYDGLTSTRQQHLTVKEFIEVFNQSERQCVAIPEAEITKPTILIHWSENTELKSGQLLPFGKGNEMIADLIQQAEKKPNYEKTRYHVVLPKNLSDNNQITVVNMDRLDLGDGIYKSPFEQICNQKNLPQSIMNALKDEIDIEKKTSSKDKAPVAQSNETKKNSKKKEEKKAKRETQLEI